jgi:alanyl-tRNA synthetase
MLSADIRSRWLRFFEERGHTVVPSASLVADDPTLLLINAGMVPFKPYFLGELRPPWQRATSVQKCVRTLDIDEVGKTARHASFFQMCGNFSFGDYFKEGAIPFAWELLTTSVADGGFGLPEDRLWVTVYLDDDEAADIWHDSVGVPRDRIQRRDKADNFWSMGVPGPCGPCSEIFYDRGPQFGAEGGPIADEERYIEIWNLVFMQYIRGEGDGKADYQILGDLPQPNIDTGLGLERTAMVLQGVDNLYEIDTTRRILDRASEISGKQYGADSEDDVRLRVVADHARTAAMLIGDGVTPGNEGRGYVLRRMMRRTIRAMRLLDTPAHSMRELTSTAIDVMAPQYPELESDRARIEQVAQREDEAFSQTLKAGTAIFDTAVKTAKAEGRTKLGGEQVFALHDTYGFPIDLTLEMASEQGLSVDESGFRELMREQRDRAKADAKAKKAGYGSLAAYRQLANDAGASTFLGYETTASDGVVRGLLRDGEVADSASEGDEIEIVLDRTPFYAESGGQVADRGRIVLPNGTVIEVLDVQSPLAGLIAHQAIVRNGEIRVGESVLSEVDVARRHATSRAHTATHLVHEALREALGEGATQAGSENSPGRFRLDFNSPSAVSQSALHDVEQRVNEILAEDLGVHTDVMTLSDARASGAIGLFGEKYGDEVRVVSVGDFSRELCGGTHATRSGQLGVITLVGESSIGSGVRRVEALVGMDAYGYLARENLLVHQIASLLNGRPDEMPERVAGLIDRIKEADRALDRIRSQQLQEQAAAVVNSARDVAGVSVVTVRAPDATNGASLRELALDARNRLGTDRPVAVVAGAVDGARVNVVAVINETAAAAGQSAHALLTTALAHVDGKGGGKGEIAQGSGTRVEGLDEGLASVDAAVRAAAQ